MNEGGNAAIHNAVNKPFLTPRTRLEQPQGCYSIAKRMKLTMTADELISYWSRLGTATIHPDVHGAVERIRIQKYRSEGLAGGASPDDR